MFRSIFSRHMLVTASVLALALGSTLHAGPKKRGSSNGNRSSQSFSKQISNFSKSRSNNTSQRHSPSQSLNRSSNINRNQIQSRSSNLQRFQSSQLKSLQQRHAITQHQNKIGQQATKQLSPSDLIRARLNGNQIQNQLHKKNPLTNNALKPQRQLNHQGIVQQGNNNLHKMLELKNRLQQNKLALPTLGKLTSLKLQSIQATRQRYAQTAHYQNSLRYAYRCLPYQNVHCRWWGHFVIDCYIIKHRRYCPNYFWDYCQRQRYIHVYCPNVQVGYPQYWYFGCEVILMPGIGYGIESVAPGSPAQLAGLQPGDMITTINGQTPENEALLPGAIQQSNGLLGLSVLSNGGQSPQNVNVQLSPVAAP